MKERPILFSAPMVRAILECRKTQTRRVVKPRRDPDTGCEMAPCEIAGEMKGGNYLLCPYGAPGDRLWVRETWSKAKSCNIDHTFYRADGDNQHGHQTALSYFEREARWRPSIHMPRWASRITLEITGVRVERLQDIQFNEADALAEGAQRARISEHAEFSACEDYKQIWRDINGPESWAANPWVWAIEFKKVQP